ncbi:hypothetical protein BCY84_01417 [Trypanosoma cruzi cruzi]|nr:hypothetical protein BCY84_04706 [Trypanosoma cruzi cruzi]PBJ80573.1 hypothetical protein BCY84_01417 [Trypanosoma cruzi cruzi]
MERHEGRTHTQDFCCGCFCEEGGRELAVCPLAWTLVVASPHEAHTIMCPLYICMHTHAGPLVLSFARHAPLPSCLAAWAEHRNCFCFVFIALSGRPLSLSLCVCFALREQ